MNKEIIKFYLVLLALASFAPLGAQVVTVNTNEEVIENFGKSFLIYEDKLANESIESVSQQLNFAPSTMLVPNLGLSKSAFWISFEVENKSENDYLVLDIAHPSLDEVWLYTYEAGSWNEAYLSDATPINSRWIKNQNYCFKLSIKSGNKSKYFLKVKSGDQIQIPARIGSLESILNLQANKDFWYGGYLGVFFIIILINFFVYLRTRDNNFIEYVAYVTLLLLTQSSFQGYTLRFVFGEVPYLERYAVFVLCSAVGIVGIRFIRIYANIFQFVPKAKYVFLLCTSLYYIAITLALLNLFQISYLVIQITATISAIAVLTTTALAFKRGSQQAGNVLLAWSVFMIGIVIFVLKDYEIIPFNTFTYNVMTIGSALEGILLSFGLADKINTLKKEKELAQMRELEASKENEQKLEQKVIERTAELEMAKNEVQRNYDHLRITQRQLVEAEKLSGLGQMTAGIAHELNNPINFVSSNIAPLNRDVDEVIKFMNEFEKLPEHTTQEQIADLKAKYKGADMPYVKQEIDQLMKGISEGTRRTAEIVKGLRIFARADRDALVKSNINECMDATLVVMKSTYKDDITLVKDLDPAIPELECFPGKLNQVFANLIGNAVHATRAMGRPKEQQFIWIKTWADNDNLYVSIKDNGKGMTDEVKAKIFEPFYTTKGVGEGTGLGLSISHGIIEEHKGTVSVNTKINEGTEFIIAIPRNLAQIRNLAA